MTVIVAGGDLSKGSNIDWHRYPMKMDAEEVRTINFGRVESILKDNRPSPLTKAGIPLKDASLILQNIERTFIASIDKYRNSLIAATNKDLQIIDRINTEWGWTGFGTAGVVSATALFLIGPIPAIMGGALGYLGGKAYDDHQNSWEIGTNRRAWFHEVNSLENERLKDLENRIILRSETLLTELELLGRDGETNQKLVHELKQLRSVYIAATDGKTLKIENWNLNNILLSINN